MAKTEILLPSMGEGVIEATITRWLVKEGDSVQEDDSLVEIATDKVDSEVPSPYDGKVEKIMVQEGDVVKVGTTLAILATGVEEPAVDRPEVMEKVQEIKEYSAEKEETIPPVTEKAGPAKVDKPAHSVQGRFLSPLVRKIISEEGITDEELETLTGTGKDGRITKQDLLGFLKGKESAVKKEPVPAEAVSPASSAEKKSTPVVSVSGEDKVIEMDRVRKLIADHMVLSKKTSPHVTTFVETDVTNMVLWYKKIKEEFLKKENQKITLTPFFVEAAAKALRDFPMVNISVDGSKIIVKRNINIGIATALPSGNLIVPVVKNADEKNLVGIAKAVNDLADRARRSKLNPDEITGGTFTITNFGTFQNLTGTPIINQPEVAIMGVGTILKKPSVIETDMGDTIGIRQKVILSLAYDHRVVDGALGGMFLKRVSDYLEKFDVDRTI